MTAASACRKGTDPAAAQARDLPRSGRILVLRPDGGPAEGDRHHRHIVAAAALERQLDQGLTGLADAEALQDFADFEILDMGRQAVAAEQELVAGPDLAIGEVEQRLPQRRAGPPGGLGARPGPRP